MPIDRTDQGASASIRADALELARRFQFAEAAPDMLAALKQYANGYTDSGACARVAISKATGSDAAIITPTPAIFVQFSDDGQFIRKWSFEPFEAGARYIPAFEPSWDNPDGPQAA